MKIAYIVPSLANAGPVNVVFDLVKVMTEHKHECSVFYFDDIVEHEFPCEVKRIRLREKVNFEVYDVVHTHGYRPSLYVLLHKPLRTKTKFITTMHNYLFSDFGYTYGVVKGFLYGCFYLVALVRMDKIITLSKDARRYYTRFLFFKNLTYAYNTRVINFGKGLNSVEKDELLSFKGNSILIGSNCVISHLKGIDQVIKILPSFPQCKFFHVGGDGGFKRYCERLAKDLKVRDRVHFSGRRDLAYRYLPYYDIFILPSRSEGFPLSLLEAAAYGRKIVTSNLAINKECFSDKEISLFELSHIDSLADAIIKAMKDDSFGNNARMRFLSDYSPECFYERHLKIYQE